MGASKTLLLPGSSTAGFADGCSPSIFLVRPTLLFKVTPTPLALMLKHRGQWEVIGGLQQSTQAEGQICVVLLGCWPLPPPCWWPPRYTGVWGVRAQWPARCLAAACSWGQGESGIEVCAGLHRADWLEVAPLGLFSSPAHHTPAHTPISVPLGHQSWGALTIRESAENMKILLNSPCKQKVQPTLLWLNYTEKFDFILSISFYIWKESGCSVWEEMGVAHLGCCWRCCPFINLLIWELMGPHHIRESHKS